MVVVVVVALPDFHPYEKELEMETHAEAGLVVFPEHLRSHRSPDEGIAVHRLGGMYYLGGCLPLGC